jgi:tungstate transport system substrate-binding protein
MTRKLIFLLAVFLLVLVACAQANEPPPGAVTATQDAGAAAEQSGAEIAPDPSGPRTILRLATTTSTENSGLLTFLLPVFEDAYGVDVDVVAVGTGQALQLGVDGNADVAGDGVRREDLMYNDFVIVGPPADPAGLRGMADVTEALATIATTESGFISRGDDSGTHVMEMSLWEEANVTPAGAWYISAGQGMGAVLTMADEQEAYALTDRATYLARTLAGTELEIIVEGDTRLFNPYGAIAVNPAKSPQIQGELANQFIDWLISLEAQELIAEFGVEEFGSPLFTPDSAQWRAAHPDG